MKLIIGNWCFSPRLLTSSLALVFICLFAYLGFWQLDRAEYKRILFTEFEVRQSSGAISLDQDKVKQANKEEMLWQTVNVNGEFLEQYQILLDNQVEQGQAGYYVYTPLKLDASEHVVLVNRGWVAVGSDRRISPDLVKTNNAISLVGVIKAEPKTGMILKDALPETLSNTVFRVQRINIEELQDLTGTKLLPYIVRLSAESEHGYDRQWQAPGSGESRHMGYAFQWFAFAVALAFIYLLLNVKKIKQDKEMSEENNNKKNKVTLILVVVAFLSPVILSWVVFNYTDIGEGRGTSNHGDLITPIRPIDDLAMIDPVNADRNDTLHGKWSLVFVSDTCNDTCMDNVYRMRQIHMMMDKHSLRVQKVLLLTAQSPDELSTLFTDYAGQQVINPDLADVELLLEKFRLEASDKPLTNSRIYIVDPLGNLMMKFEPDANPRDIMKDLKKLLRASRIG